MYKMAANIEVINLENDGVIFNKQSEDVYSIDSVGLEILSMITDPTISYEKLEEQLLNEYDVDADTLRKDLEVFLFQMLRIGIIEKEGAE